jgi:hypothetical protein
MPDGRNVGEFLLRSQITGGTENAVPLHVDIPRTGGRGSNLPFEAVLQGDLKFPYEYFLLHLPFVLQTTPAEKNHND